MNNNWIPTNLENIFEIKYGKGLPKDSRNKTGEINVYGSNGIIGKHDKTLTNGITIIIDRKGSVGEVNFSFASCWPIDTTYYIDNFHGNIPPKYWMYLLKSLNLGCNDKSSAIPGINRNDIYKLEVLLPPVEEQLRNKHTDDICHAISKQYFLPLYEYFCEKIEDNNTMLYLLDRYRHRTEWFHKERLFKAYFENTTYGEDILTKDLQEYLYNQAIDYPFSTPLTPIGRPDIVGLIDTPEPLVLEVKIFNLEQNYGKGYIRKGSTQAYKYASVYGKPVGYLLIYNLDEKELVFEKKPDETVKSIQIGDKIIYIICVNIFCNNKSASEMKKILPYIIEDSYLKNLDEDGAD